MQKDDRRGAERYTPPKPVPATFGGFEVKILEISLIGCRIEHPDRLPPKAKLGLRFNWRNSPVRIDATVIRSELTSLGKKPSYLSGLEFADLAHPVIRDIVGYLAAAAKKAEPVDEPLPDLSDEPEPEPVEELEELSANYLRCTFEGGKWSKVFVDDPTQPAGGFTILAPNDEREADVLCRAWETADAAKRQIMRASFQKKLAGGA